MINLLANPGFEDGVGGGWAAGCAAAGCIRPAPSTVARSGRASALLRASPNRWELSWLRQRVPLAQPCRLRFSAFVRAADGTDGLPAAELQLAVRSAAADAPLCRLERRWPARAWEQLVLDCPLPSAATDAEASIELVSVRSDAAALVDEARLWCASEGEEEAGGKDGGAGAASSAAAVPRLLHFIFGLSADFGGKPFGLVHHLVIAAAQHAAAPVATYFYYAHEPSGEWWEAAKPSLALRKVVAPTSVFGRPVRKFAHQADVLLSFGGIYLDLDGVGGSIGVGNALMLTPRNHSFFREWYEAYRAFSDAVWNGFSVRLPSRLAAAAPSSAPSSVRVLAYGAFYWPPWNPWGVAQLYRSERCLLRGGYAVHLWETKLLLTPADGAVASAAGGGQPCGDDAGEACAGWAGAGECSRNPGFMERSCRRSCGLCGGGSAAGGNTTVNSW
ncbi:hypothetical protein EMIHUDRAFT_244523 [Emiliania huxleyi CCMP1516]|uniref:ShKT domain-containing protein n=2 Tax=Emiliania huxleyi TaxID=2903 RepID=A0A0D3J0M0_EMIH1|nr:hypothetical protein EMIHUDRAFT_244523 [Emiliania huxleyi CCMP1516]EOD17055.1 hypothetical protein EMIHUDRAFT_244523 [Emiliania huxleyi CCMP1516]|eukprot:XP_005769484.1 hypothetical protein EMIHUDRAFT_244523 [Emiliania huxleyi CCMP1516]